MNESLTFEPWKLNKNHTKRFVTHTTSVDEIHTTFEIGNTKTLIKKGCVQQSMKRRESMKVVSQNFIKWIKGFKLGNIGLV